MGFKIRELDKESKFCNHLTLEAISRAVPKESIRLALEKTHTREQRVRKLTLVMTVFVLIAMNIYVSRSIGGVVRKLSQGLRFVWPDPEYELPKDSAVAYRRVQLGARPMVALFHELCRPMATPKTQGAFLFGLRLMAIDGTKEDVPDSPANAAVFGRHRGQRGESAFPQIKGVYLVECGTHVIVDAGFWPCHTSERLGGQRLLRSVGEGMLLMWDRGFHDYDLVWETRRRGAHVLGRLPAHVKPICVCKLADGSYLAYLRPSDYRRRKGGERMLVRIVEYTITDPALEGYGKVHRLLTTLLSHHLAPAMELACAYHERWEIEVVIDEIDTHQRLAMRTLRSLKPVGVIQELYALLIAHYAIRTLMHEAALEAEVDVDRLSFVHALEIVQDAIPEFQMTAPEHQDQLYERLLRDIASKRLPERRVRSNARVVKRKMSSYRLKRDEEAPGKVGGLWRDAIAVLQGPGGQPGPEGMSAHAQPDPVPIGQSFQDIPTVSVKLHLLQPCLI
jgi:hypothetical protein